MFRYSHGVVAVVREVSKRSASLSPGRTTPMRMKSSSLTAATAAGASAIPRSQQHAFESRRARYASQPLNRQVIQYAHQPDPDDYEREGDSVKEIPYLIPSAMPSNVTTNPDVRNIEDLLFDVFKNEQGRVPVGKFVQTLLNTGLRKDDPRLEEFNRHILNAQQANSDLSDLYGLTLDRETFHACIRENLLLISRAFLNSFIIPEWQEFCNSIDEIYWNCRALKDGKVASYIPQLARFSPDYWGVSICTVDGQRHSIGNTDIPFCLQSCSKPLSYLLALEELGPEIVHQYVGQEPSGRIFNELVLDYNRKPHNPLVNAGAIIITSLLKRQSNLADRFDYVLKNFQRMAGGEHVGFSNATFLSERETADRNYALGYYMRENKCFPEGANLTETMDFYFQLCSVEVNCESVAVMAATMAHGGMCPITGERLVKNSSVRDALSLMYSCGMYDYSGQFAFRVGMPAKSGVCGAIMVVIPNVAGLCAWSPPLDHYGNSVRGVEFCKELVSRFNFHNFDNIRQSPKKSDPRHQKSEAKGLRVVSLLFSAASGDLVALRRLYLKGLDMNQCDYDGRTALHLAASEGHEEVVRFLLERCNVVHNPKDRWGHTPLEDAELFGHDRIAQIIKDWEKQLDVRMAIYQPEQLTEGDITKSP
ncbi:glutaminase liver isoform, mitochondrial-like isoform X1 [Paramacrobiotus metropolitanus]|uniref:glutaminase liver isoform, mitochondrial-like isoform X1 n=1 Tax=Paramacrobiotus metropolitanus TaxID=2943436 RepID=UPI002445B84B|nr:glutaminase liver isoform, mitochondrial-like isoform X1 [Paramacrobiotus metropolitanus]